MEDNNNDNSSFKSKGGSSRSDSGKQGKAARGNEKTIDHHDQDQSKDVNRRDARGNRKSEEPAGGSNKTKSSKSSRDNRRQSGKIVKNSQGESGRGSGGETNKTLDESRKSGKRTSDATSGEGEIKEDSKKHHNVPVIEHVDADDEGHKIFRLSNPTVNHSPPKKSPAEDDKQSTSSKGGKGKRYHTPPPSSVEEEFYETESLELMEEHDEMGIYEDGEDFYSYNSTEEGFEGDGEEEGETDVAPIKSRNTMLREKWEEISFSIVRTFDSPCRVFRLRGYHSEPDLTIPFEDKFDPKLEAFQVKGDKSKWRKFQEKYVSCEDIAGACKFGMEHPDLVRGVLSEVKLRSYAIDENMKNSWWELHDWEKKRFSFFDELFAMGYVVDSLEVLSPPPKGDNGQPVKKGEYFVEADERHFRKKVDYGRVVFKTKHVYTGNFQDWYFEGPGRYCWQDGTVYQGEFSNGLMHGPGSIHWPDGCIYDGHFIYGKRTGWGVYSSGDGRNTYAGEWLNGLPHGHGKMWYDPEDDDNDYYEGQWDRGLPQGVGTRQYSTGDRYVGNWVGGMRNEYGIMIWLQERQVYRGDWMDGVPHGFGKHIWYLERTASNSFPTRHVYQGNWVHGRREGIGKMVYPCGSVYEGRWKNGQRHGKGMFINPAGDILVGLFRAGSILGGSDVPLHAPTYECDYAGLTEWLTVRFKLKWGGGGGAEIKDNKEEEALLEITKQYLPYIRKLYHRAGEYSQKYGQHGLYPAYMKKTNNRPSKHPPPSSSVRSSSPEFQSTVHDTSYHVRHHREYSRLDEPEHMKGKLEKPESLDGVNPVTRFGLWLLLRDCDNILDEVTMAYYDKIWCETPPLSFQTRHNPFEPIYLWQFLQALIVASVAYFVDIPRIRQHAIHENQSGTYQQMEAPAVSDTTLRGGISFAEHRRTMLHQQHKQATMQQYIPNLIADDQQTAHTKKSKHHKTKSTPNVAATKDNDATKGKHNKTKHGGMGEGVTPSITVIHAASKTTVATVVGDGKGSFSSGEGKGAGEPPKRSKMGSQNLGIVTKRVSHKVGGGGGDDEKHSKVSKNEKGRKTKHHLAETDPLSRPIAGIDEEDFSTEEGEEAEDEMLEDDEDEDDVSYRKSVGFLGEKTNDGEETGIYHESTTTSPFLSGFSISECFEKFLDKKLLPCLRREPGSNLPVMPKPLPALVDMYDAFKGLKERDIVKGKEFLRTAVPHLMFPAKKDALWWHRCPEPLSHNVNLDELLETLKEKFANDDEEYAGMEFGGDTGNFEQKFESEYLGGQAQNSETTLRLLKICRDDPLSIECTGGLEGLETEVTGYTPTMPIVNSEEVLAELRGTNSEEELLPMSEFITEGTPFAEDDLVPEPFLWADDYKCIPVRRKYQHFENISTKDVINVIHQLYPKLCKGKHENNLQFDFIFCDWLWCISLLAKTSTEREVRDAWKKKSEASRPFTNPQSLGVYAHFIKQIKNNPYLTPTPPADFIPKIRPKHEHANEEKKAVKFSF